ncbi:hypothetical protein GT370_12425 [Acidocella sp. MX-AZ03]|uniref:hypothetical protein n=1 Tax=Acidocella sp. MX-AZ03 TaxID=2697363 RepID=UPI0022DDD705|nr:hypothetical protein [Acidocella sp. MX-AZ03]WBO58066.1 hypothetical protein GT370_12425 [Acidocella sp. MX-AZ03]
MADDLGQDGLAGMRLLRLEPGQRHGQKLGQAPAVESVESGEADERATIRDLDRRAPKAQWPARNQISGDKRDIAPGAGRAPRDVVAAASAPAVDAGLADAVGVLDSMAASFIW